MIDLSKVKEITIKEGSVAKITDSNGVVWWEKKPSSTEVLSMLVRYKDGTDKKFYNLTSIDNITVSNKANAVSVEIYDGVTSIGDDAFGVCTSLSSVTMPNSVTSIGNYTFYRCSSLSSITIPNSVKTMGGSTFDSCSSLKSIDIPYGVTEICGSTFDSCSSLTSVTIPNTVTSIGNFTFYRCSSLSSIDFPSSVKSIDVGAFDYCSSLSSVTIESTTKLTYNTNAFQNIASNAVLRVPSTLVEEYQADTQWTNAFKGGIERIGAVGEIENGSGSIGVIIDSGGGDSEF